MNDVTKRCAKCGHEHRWGIVNYSEDNVPLYGPRMCTAPVGRVLCGCVDFIEASEGQELVAATPPEELKQLWEDTSFLSAQTPMETRIAVRQIQTLEGSERERAFMGVMLSQVADIRATISRDENKFAHLVSHTDEIVESMKGATQLAEKLASLSARIDETNDRIDRIGTVMERIAAKLGVEEEVPVDASDLVQAARSIFKADSGPKLRNEAVEVDDFDDHS